MNTALSSRYIGIMSGTSLDGVDAVLADFSCATAPVLLGTANLPMPAALRAELLQLNTPGDNELERAALAANQLVDLYIEATQQLLQTTGLSPEHIRAIGAHGQTVRHAPHQGYTIQLNAPARLAHQTGIAVIADFRSRDIAGGGQGAPLVPVVHQALFSAPYSRAILNLGGMGNLTLLHPERPAAGFDTGPANVLLDLWVQQHRGEPFDHNGSWAESGRVNPALLHHLLETEPWFAELPPKSTGRDRFNSEWLASRLDAFCKGTGLNTLEARDVQATLQQLTAVTVQQMLERGAPDCQEVLVCGGGALSAGMMRTLAAALPCPVASTASAGIAPMAVESLAFAWLAWAHENGRPAGLPQITGTERPVVLGCRYPA